MESVLSRPCRLVAATSSIARLTAPATSIASATSDRVTLSSQRRCGPAFGVTVPVAGQAGVQVHRVRHHRRAEHRGGEQHALGAVEPRNQARGHIAARRGLDEQACQEPDRDD